VFYTVCPEESCIILGDYCILKFSFFVFLPSTSVDMYQNFGLNLFPYLIYYPFNDDAVKSKCVSLNDGMISE
jgi:hypothetical protein